MTLGRYAVFMMKTVAVLTMLAAAAVAAAASQTKTHQMEPAPKATQVDCVVLVTPKHSQVLSGEGC